jgi:hypothetical protein
MKGRRYHMKCGMIRREDCQYLVMTNAVSEEE